MDFKNIKETGYHDYISDNIFCNDRSFKTNMSQGFGSYLRVIPSYEIIPKLICPQENDKFTVKESSGGNGALLYPVGLITADEPAYI